jgi:CO/xanthine dehydrogenase FAD-binding subunit
MLQAVLRPKTLPEAVALLAEPGTRLLGGGTLTIPEVTAGVHGIARLVTLSALSEPLKSIRVSGTTVTIGALTTLAEIEDAPGLAFLQGALDSIGSPTLRNQATVGGNLFAPQPYGDLAVCLVALGATAQFVSATNERGAKVEDVVREAAPAGEILASVSFPMPDPLHWRYLKAMRRKRNSASIVTVAALVPTVDGRIAGARVALGGVAPTPIRSPSAEAALEGVALDHAVASAAGEAAKRDAKPFTDAYASAWYRSRVLPVHVRRALIGA